MSMHQDGIAGHLNHWHGPSNPACIRMATAEEHAARGWDVTEYPQYIR